MGLTTKDPPIRRAIAADACALTEIAHAAKRHWGYPERWIEIWRDALTITPDFISIHEVYAASVDGKIAGFSASRSRGESWLDSWVVPGPSHGSRQTVVRPRGWALSPRQVRPRWSLIRPNAEASTGEGDPTSWRSCFAIEGEKRVLRLLASISAP